MATQLVIFDFDGTLFDTHASISHCIKLTFDQLLPAQSPGEPAVHKLISSGAGLSETFEALHPDPACIKSDMDRWTSTYRALYAEHGQPLIRAFPGAAALLAALAARHVPCAIVSNKGVAAVTTALANNDLEGAVPTDLIVGDKTPGATRKPDVSSYTNVLAPTLRETYGLEEPLNPARVLVVGDTVADIRFATNLGATAVWCSYGYGDRTDCAALKPTHTIGSLEEVIPLIQS